MARENSLAKKEDKTIANYEKNRRQTQFMAKCIELGTGANRKDLGDLKMRFYKYLQLCDEMGFKVTNMASYTAMGIDRFVAKDFTKGTPEQKELIRFVKNICAMSRELQMSEGTLNPIIGIYWQKAFDNLSDIPQEEIGVETDISADVVEVKEKYKYLENM